MPPNANRTAAARKSARKPARNPPRKKPEPRDPERTRERLIEAAAHTFNKVGYLGTDTNRIARAAGYAPGTFYKHFTDKRAIFLEAYLLWVDAEWRKIDAIVGGGRKGARNRLVDRLTNEILRHHQRWGGFRAALVGLAATDPDVAAFRIESRKRQMAWLDQLLERLGARPAPPARRLAVLLTFERLCDSVAWGEASALGIKRSEVLAELRGTLGELIG